MGSSPLPPAFYLSGFGTSEVYRGQTFIVPAGDPVQADRVSVFFATNTSPDASFRVLITAVERSPDLHPTQVLFESETYTLPILGGNQEIAVNLGGLLLTPGVEYAWIVDHLVVAPAMGNTSMSLGLGEYAAGQSFQFPNGPDRRVKPARIISPPKAGWWNRTARTVMISPSKLSFQSRSRRRERSVWIPRSPWRCWSWCSVFWPMPHSIRPGTNSVQAGVRASLLGVGRAPPL